MNVSKSDIRLMPSGWVWVWRDGDSGAFLAERRSDGWPICPFCDGDELYSLDVLRPGVETIAGCYVCGPLNAAVTP